MTKKQFEKLGEALGGTMWRAYIAALLKINPRQLYRCIYEKAKFPSDTKSILKDEIDNRIAALKELRKCL